MELFVLVVVVVLGSLVSAQDNQTTLDELFFSEYNQQIHELLISHLLLDPEEQNVPPSEMTFVIELIQYTKSYVNDIVIQFAWNLGNISVQSVLGAINGNCSMEIEDLTDHVEDLTCVEPLLREMVTSKLNHAIDSVLLGTSHDCDQTYPTLCSAWGRNCTSAYEERVRTLMTTQVQDFIAQQSVFATEPLSITAEVLNIVAKELNANFVATNFNSLVVEVLNKYDLSNETFGIVNILKHWFNKLIVVDESYTFNEELTWGIINSNVGGVEIVCCDCQDTENKSLWLNSTQLKIKCYQPNMRHSFEDLIICIFKDVTAKTLTWRSTPNIYFSSPCLCLVLKGDNCGVNPPAGVDTHVYCLSVLLRDFQRRITYRPAVTYLDYASKTPLPPCNFTELMYSTMGSLCIEPHTDYTYDELISMQCYFKELVNKDLNCTERLPLITFNKTLLCDFGHFMSYVHCDANKFYVTYYRAGDSTLVQVLTYADVISRVLTLVSYTACPPLRNIPGKLMMCYLMTTVMRLLVVHNTHYDLQWAVRLDVTMDLASTFWLTAYLHFLTTSIKTLRLPDSLTASEVRQVYLRYCLFGWVLPVALSAIFFCMDDVIDSHVQFGQMLFVLCTYAALFTNLYMFFFNCSFYYAVISSARDLGPGVRPRNVFADIFNFALKTSVLSGAGIIFRLVLTQIPGLEHFLGYYHVVGTLQGLLLFLLYGCCREARVFWINLFSRMIGRCNCPQNTSSQDNALQLEEIPVPESLQKCSSS